MADPNDELRGRAYAIWETEGRPEGRDLDHWLQAERESAGVVPPPEDGPVPEADAAVSGADAGSGRSAEAGIEQVLEADEAIDPKVTGAASLVESES